ncbi:MAG: hypothetical protein Q7S95_02370 [bacterium]|nr:hypothetical protein [bacterium]
MRRIYRPRPLKPRGALSRPAGSHLAIEIFSEKPGQYPAVRITAEAHSKIRALVAACRLEISWLSPAKVAPDGSVVIYDVLVPHQVCSLGSTAKLATEELDGEDLLLTELMNARRLDVIRDLICWGHSHVNGAVFVSGTDEEMTWDFVRRMREMGKTRFVRLIANKGDDLSASLYLLDEGKAIHHAPIEAEPPDIKQWAVWARREVGDKVAELVLPPAEYGDYDEFGWGFFYDQAMPAGQKVIPLHRPQPGQSTTAGGAPLWPKRIE